MREITEILRGRLKTEMHEELLDADIYLMKRKMNGC